MNLIETFENGNFNNLGKPDRIIETMISKLFFFDDYVYKVYKYEGTSFSNNRSGFYHDDFLWNNSMSPDIYLELVYVKKVGDSFEQTTQENAEDYFILMKKFDDSMIMNNLIGNNSFDSKHLGLITEQKFERLSKLTEIKKEDMADLFEMSYRDLSLSNLNDLPDWLTISDFMTKEEAESILSKMFKFTNEHLFFTDFDKNQYLISIDNHGANILIDGDQINFIDSMPPKREWRIQSDVAIISRPATDIEVLIDKNHSDIMYEKFEQIRNIKIDPQIRAYFQIYAALIKAPYMHFLNDPESAKRFLDFAKEKLQLL
jgi:aminoglycoside phosphotransferase family enzyme